MSSDFLNAHDNRARAASYAALEFPRTYDLAYRDLPSIIGAHAHGRTAVDFGCGAGRSTRFLCTLGFDAVGVDIAEPMISLARERDPNGEYLLVPDGDLSVLRPGTFDLVFSVFTFNNVPTIEKKVALFTSLKELLTPGGRIVSLVSTPDIYRNEWASFSTKDFPGNRTARSGKKVFTVMLDVDDRRPVTDFLGTDGDRYEVYGRAGLVPLLT